MSATPQTIGCDIQVEGHNLIVTLPDECSDMTMNWSDLFRFADAIGSVAFEMRAHVSDPGQDEAEADFVRVGRCGDCLAVVYLREKRNRLVFTRNAALLLAEKMATMAETIADEVEKQRK